MPHRTASPRRLLLLPAFVLALAGLFVLTEASAQVSAPTSGTMLADGLAGSIGSTIGPDGALYVAEGGTGGDTVVTVPGEGGADQEFHLGLSGKVTRIDPSTGATSTVAEGIPSTDFGDGSGTGVVDVAFMGNTLYYLLTGVGTMGFPGKPLGVYKVNADKTSTLVADIETFNHSNPVAFPDADPSGNPYGLTVLGSDFYVTDGNFNRVLKVTTAGAVSVVKSYDNVVPTGITSDGTNLYHTELGAFPHPNAAGRLMKVTTAGVSTDIGGGVSQLIDVAFGPNGKTYVLSFADVPDNTGQSNPNSGQILVLNADGSLTPLVTGFMMPTSLNFSGNTAFVVTLTGEAWKIANFQTITPTATATATATATSTATSTATATATSTTTATSTATATATATATPTSTPTPLPTATPVPPTATPTATTPPPTPTKTATVAPGAPNTGTGTGATEGGNWLLYATALAAFLAAGGTATMALRRR